MSGKHVDIEHWSRIAAEWTAWARAPNHDAFWAYRASLLAFIGQGAGDALDVGCGEGRVSRVLKDCGYRVTAIDPVEQLISAANRLDRPTPTRSRRPLICRSRIAASTLPSPTMC